jgi:hypothetical protein
MRNRFTVKAADVNPDKAKKLAGLKDYVSTTKTKATEKVVLRYKMFKKKYSQMTFYFRKK